MPKIYLAGPLFTLAEINFNKQLCAFLQANGYQVFLPQDACEGKHLTEIFATCKGGIDQSDLVVAVLDGADADSGTCWECGYAYANGKPYIGLRTDFRGTGDTRGFNAMMFFGASAIVEGAMYENALLDALQKLA